MKFINERSLWITPLRDTPVFEKTILPQDKSTIWERQILSPPPVTAEKDLSPRAQQILAQSRQIQAQLQKLTQGRKV